MLNYKYYTTTEMLDILTSERIYYSHHHTSTRGLLHNPDSISLCSTPFDHEGQLKVVCEIWNNMEGTWDVLAKRGFTRDANDSVYYKNWHILVNPGKDIGLLDRVVKTLDTAAKSAPLLLYASEICRSLFDYHAFVGMTLPKIGIGELTRNLGYPEDCDFSTCGEAGESPDFLIAHYKREWWAAWVGGDTIIPLFPSEFEARSFVTNRARRSSPLGKPAIRTLPAVMKSRWPKIYILADPARSITERLAWLQREQALLQREERMIFPKQMARGE